LINLLFLIIVLFQQKEVENPDDQDVELVNIKGAIEELIKEVEDIDIKL